MHTFQNNKHTKGQKIATEEAKEKKQQEKT